jgi:hypothetical protein
MTTMSTLAIVTILTVGSAVAAAPVQSDRRAADCARASERFAAAARNVSGWTNEKLQEEALLQDCLASGKRDRCAGHRAKIRNLQSQISRETAVQRQAESFLNRYCRGE